MNKSFVSLIITVLFPGYALGYEMTTHYLLTRASFSSSDLAKPGILENLGLKAFAAKQMFSTTAGPDDTQFDQTSRDLPCGHSTSEPVARLVACGGMFEDISAIRVLNHFFDPAHDGRRLTVLDVPLPFTYSSPDWALGEQAGADAQNFSYAKARLYEYDALTHPSTLYRAAAWGQLFQTLGQVVHHLQDMTQPQHVRNDPHLDKFDFGINLGLFNNPSLVERYTGFNPRGIAKVNNAIAASTMAPVFPAYQSNFTVPRRFWAGDGKGAAEFTNGNFVSDGTNFSAVGGVLKANHNYPAPEPGSLNVEPMSSLFGTAVPRSVDHVCNDHLSAPEVYLANCYMTFYSTAVIDRLTGETTSNRRASTYSVFDEELYRQAGQPAFALNRFNYDAALEFLVPRAVAYGAGLINYFFRGQMEISLPDDGIYAILDHTVNDTTPAGCGTPCGFRKLKLKLKNKTPTDDMGAGVLVAVAKYHLNNCYQPDLSGEFGAPAFTGAACRSAEEAIAVSNPRNVDAVEREPQALEFTFPNSAPIPINATDLYLQVIYKGKLGQEDDAVMVTTMDIHEPTFITFGNHTDSQAVYNSDGTFSRTEAVPPELFNIEVRFSQDRTSPSASSTPVHAASFHRIAVLTDQDPIDYWLFEHEISGHTSTRKWSFNTTVNQTDAQHQTRNFPSYVTLRRTTSSDWEYMPNLPGAVIYWNWGYWCVDRTTNCSPVDKTNDAWVRHFPPFALPTAAPMVIDF